MTVRYLLIAARHLGLVVVLALEISVNVNAQISTGDCPTPVADAYLNVNNVRARVPANGNLFWRSDPSVYEVPKDDGTGAIFSAAFWLGGKVGSDVRVAAARYGRYQFWTGPIHDGLQPPPDCSVFDKVWKINRQDIEHYNAGAPATFDLSLWPTGLGAPTVSPLNEDGSAVNSDGVDNDGDGEADEADERRSVFDDIASQPLALRIDRTINLLAGERPDMIGDQMLWWINNDIGNEHVFVQNTTSEISEAIGVEVHNTAFAFNQPGDIGNTTFYRVKVIYKGTVPFTDAYVGFFVDPDLGNFSDDYVGSDTLLGMGYVYNADNDDGGSNGYGENPPAAGFDLFQGPIVPSAGDTANVGGRPVPDFKNLAMTTFISYANGSETLANTDPNLKADYYNNMRGLWKDGTPIKARGDGLNTIETATTNFMFSGDPTTGGFWSEFNVDGNGLINQPADRRFVMAAGPFTLQPGDVQEIVYGVVWARGDSNLDSVTELKIANSIAQSTVDAIFRPIVTDDSCPNTDYSLTTQAAVSAFPHRCSSIKGSLSLSGSDIVDLSALQNIDSVGANLVISDNTLLTSLAGLEGITDVGSDLSISGNAFLADLSTGITIVGGNLSIVDNAALTNLSGLVELTAVGGNVQIVSNQLLADCSHGLFALVSEGGISGALTMNGNDISGDCNNNGADLSTETAPPFMPDQVYVALAANQDTSITLVIENRSNNLLGWEVETPYSEALSDFLVTHNAAGPVVPPDYGAFAFDNSGFPHPTTADRPFSGVQQSTTDATWGVHTFGGVNKFGPVTESGTFLNRIRWQENRQRIGGHDYEIRFTSTGSLAMHLFEDSSLTAVPFELWRIGNAADSNTDDDVRLIPIVLELPHTQPGVFDIGGDHFVSGGDNDPYSDPIYWYEPVDLTPGESGYQEYIIDSKKIGGEVFARFVLVNWNGGSSVSTYNALMPEEGTVFQIRTAKDVFRGATPLQGEIAPFDASDIRLDFSTYVDAPGRYVDTLVVRTSDAVLSRKTIRVIVDIAAYEQTLAVNPALSTEYHFLNGTDTVATVAFSDFGSVTQLQVREHSAVLPDLLAPALTRFYDVDAAGGDGFEATLKVHYRDSDLVDGGVTSNELDLELMRWNESRWVPLGGVIDPDNNWISVSGLSKFGRFAIADPNVVFVGVDDIDEDGIHLESIFPNPASRVVNIGYSIAAADRVRIELYDALGRLVAVVLDSFESGGSHVIQRQVDSLPSGVYFVRLTSGSRALNTSLIVTR